MTDPMMTTLPTTETAGGVVPSGTGPGGAGAEDRKERSASLWADAWRDLRKNVVFLISCFIILVVGSMALFPTLWTSQDPQACHPRYSKLPPSWEHPFGYSVTGCDYYAQAIHGARPSLTIAILATIGILLVGGTLGIVAGFYGGWVDAIISRIVDIFFSLPFLLGAIVFLSLLKPNEVTEQVASITGVLIVLGWVSIARITRGSVIATRALDYVQAARALGASNSRLMFRHILPNAIAPAIVVATIALGSFVSAEATITFIGVGLRAPAVSWGTMIAAHQQYINSDPWLLAFPGGLLVATVLAFILAGDALRDALDPRLR